MPANTQELRRRIRGTKSIRQITKAMEMIAASKMRRAQQAALMSRPYADLAWEMVEAITQSQRQATSDKAQGAVHPLLKKPKKENVVLTMLVAPNRGLCGSLPAQVITTALKDASHERFITVGRKAERAVLRAGKTIVAHFDGFEGQPQQNETRSIAQMLSEQFTGGHVDAVEIVYADFVSTLQYNVKRMRLLPIGERDPDLGSIGKGNEAKPAGNDVPEFLFEPSPQAVLDSLLPRLVELSVYQVIVEALASEHSSRMVTMQNATKAADDLIGDFTLTYNRARQAAITAELADITGGRLAVAA